MAATLIFELLCVASAVFMICFLIALFRDGKRKTRCQVVHITSPHPETDGAIRASSAGSRRRFKVIAGGLDRISRKVG